MIPREPLLLPTAALAVGIAIGHFLYFQGSDLVVPASLSILALSLAVFGKTSRRVVLLTICAAVALAGIFTQIVHRQGAAPQLAADDAETVLLSGCVTNPPVFSPTREQFTLQLAPQAAARITVNLKNGEKLGLQYGQQLEIVAKVRSPRNYQNPESFDYAGYLAKQRIYWTGSVHSVSDIRILPGQCGAAGLGGIYAIRTWALGRIADLYPNDARTAALLQAILLGETTGVDRRWTSDFRLTGTYHALVISGQHVSVLAFTLLTILSLLRMRRVPALCVATAGSWLYALVSGMSSPVVRAAGGFTLFLIASYCFRKTRILNILSAVAIVYLAVDPDQLFDPSFQLSFLSAAAIAAFAIPFIEDTTGPFREAVKRFDQPNADPSLSPRAAEWCTELRLLCETICVWTKLPETMAHWLVAKGVTLSAFILDAMIVSACVQFGLALPMILYFHRLSITGLSANIIVIPLLSLVVPLGFAAIFTGWQIVAIPTKFLLHLAELTAAWHVRFEPSWRIAALPVSLSLAFAVSLILLAVAIRKGRLWTIPATAVSLSLFAVLLWQPWKPELRPGQLEVTAIDVSQGDSLLLVFPNGQTMLVDAGGFPGAGRMVRKPQIDVGEDVVSPYLWSRRIRHLDYAVLTHGHSDHMDGLPAILDNFHPSALWVGAEPETEAWLNVRRHASADHVAIVPMTRASLPIDIGGAHVRILAPSVDYAPADAPENNDSLVFEVTYGRRSVLMTGDAERPVEQELASSGQLHPVTLLKVGHHGSKTSSSEEFLSQLNPQFAFISDGYLNQFHHPHPSVLDRLATHHTCVLRTDQHGLVTFRTDGDKIEVDPFH